MSDTGVRSGVETVDKAWETNAMDEVQRKHECCGKISPNDYILLNQAVPSSCFVDQDPSKDSNLFNEGCKDKLQHYYESESYYFAIVSWCLVAFEVCSRYTAYILGTCFALLKKFDLFYRLSVSCWPYFQLSTSAILKDECSSKTKNSTKFYTNFRKSKFILNLASISLYLSEKQN